MRGRCSVCGEWTVHKDAHLKITNMVQEAIKLGLTLKEPNSPRIHRACLERLRAWLDWKKRSTTDA